MDNVDYTQDSIYPAQLASFRSMRNVSAKNRAAWLELFADDAVVQDPVGVSPFDPTGQGHRGKEAIGRFWDRVIARQEARFVIRESYPSADECANLVTTTQTLPNKKQLDVSFIVVYRVNADGLIVSLKAYWQYEKMQQAAAVLMAGN